MPHKVRWEVVCITGKYQTADGEKNRYARLGVVMENDKGALSLKLETVPINWDGWAYLNDPKPRDGNAPRPQRKSDDIPF